MRRRVTPRAIAVRRDRMTRCAVTVINVIGYGAWRQPLREICWRRSLGFAGADTRYALLDASGRR